MDLSQISLLAFAGFSLIRIVSYLPQIAKVASDSNGASAISYTTWFLWTGSHLATGLYAAVNLQDVFLSATSGIYAACCASVIVLTAMKRHSSRIQLASSAFSDSKRDSLIQLVSARSPHLGRG